MMHRRVTDTAQHFVQLKCQWAGHMVRCWHHRMVTPHQIPRTKLMINNDIKKVVGNFWINVAQNRADFNLQVNIQPLRGFD